jgi:hypothetical protein
MINRPQPIFARFARSMMLGFTTPSLSPFSVQDYERRAGAVVNGFTPEPIF